MSPRDDDPTDYGRDREVGGGYAGGNTGQRLHRSALDPNERPQIGDSWGSGHRGRGPKGYTRPDRRIHEDISDRLSDDPGLDASEVEVEVLDGEVTLKGSVGSRADRRRAEDIVEGVSGVRHVANALRVQGGQDQGGDRDAGSSRARY